MASAKRFAMPTIKNYRAYGLRYLLFNLLSLLPFIPVIVFIWLRASSGIWDSWTWGAFAIFLAGGVFGLWWQHRRHTRIQCPQCGQLIRHESFNRLQPGDPINFYCKQCDIEWVTGLSVPTDWD